MSAKIIIFTILVGIAGFCAGWATGRSALHSEDYHQELSNPLEGLKGVSIKFQEVSQEVRGYGLEPIILRPQIEQRLRNAGIRIFTKEEAQKQFSRPELFVEINVIKRPEGFFASYMRLILLEDLRVPENGAFIRGACWTSGGSEGVVDSREPERLVNDLMNHVAIFTSDYQRSNPPH